MTSQYAPSAIESATSARAESAARAYHPLPNLLGLSAPEILSHYRNSQIDDFTKALTGVREEMLEITDQIELLSRYLACYPSSKLERRLKTASVESLFREMHEHVITHPVWVHPFFARVAEGEVTLPQLRVFAQQYFNQVKNTRQCVALALGRFHSFIDRSDGLLNIALSEMTQVILAGLLGDEYGTSVSLDCADQNNRSDPWGSANIGKLFSTTTHPALFRRFLDALGLSIAEYDVPMLHGTADNVLVQRILASDPSYDELEALASVGLGMEWGVPAFFSMLIAGIVKVARRDGLALSPAGMEIWSSHVKQDVQHAIAVTIATCFYVRDTEDIDRIRAATNVLMAFRYEMMSDIYEDVFGSDCARIAEVPLEPVHRLRDRRIEPLLLTARRQVSSLSVRDYEAYLRSEGALPLPMQ
jgi:pyrroloquinoline quinone (PQQ) biosynthesis protein C